MMNMPHSISLDKYIEIRETDGRPYVKGRRIPVATLAHSAKSEGWSITDLANEFGLSEQEVLSALLYYGENAEDIEAQEKTYQDLLDEDYHRHRQDIP
jgi:uncharacterized protein (DUF433 family)